MNWLEIWSYWVNMGKSDVDNGSSAETWILIKTATVNSWLLNSYKVI